MNPIKCIYCDGGKTAEPPHKTVLCLGNFDGVHKAHRLLLSDTVKLAEKLGATPAVWFFDPPASDFLCDAKNRHLSTLDEKSAVFSQYGIKYAFVADFPTLRDFSCDSFIRNILTEQCHAVGCSCGYDFRFGANGLGTSNDLIRAFGRDNVSITDMVKFNGTRISSTLIRAYIENGDVSTAAEMLGGFYSFESVVVHGKALGRTLGFPTANQYIPAQKIIPRKGVYASVCSIDGISYPAVTNIGSKPTVSCDGQVNSESFIIGFDGDIYGKIVKTSLSAFLRDEQKYADIESLKNAIYNDVRRAERLFSDNGGTL